MSYGLRVSFGRLVKRDTLSLDEVVYGRDYRDVKQSNEYETEDYKFGRYEESYCLVNKRAIVKEIRV